MAGAAASRIDGACPPGIGWRAGALERAWALPDIRVLGVHGALTRPRSPFPLVPRRYFVTRHSSRRDHQPEAPARDISSLAGASGWWALIVVDPLRAHPFATSPDP